MRELAWVPVLCAAGWTNFGFARGSARMKPLQRPDSEWILTSEVGGCRLRRLVFFLFLVSVASAQTSAGGKWAHSAAVGKLTDAKTEQFYLFADAEVTDPVSGLKSRPVINILCSGSGHLDGIQFQTFLVLAVPSSDGQKVRVKVDNEFSTMHWVPYADRETMGIGKRDLERLLKANDLKIEFKTYPAYSVVAQFSPAGLNREMLAQSCGLK